MSRRASVAGLFGAAPASVAGAVRMLGAAASDTASVIDPRRLVSRRPEQDPFDLRDPDYIRRTLPALRALSEIYFRAEVSGLDNIPAHGPVLLVGNHSGGSIIVDTFVLAQAFYDHFGADRVFHQLAHDLVFKVPGVRALLTPYGTVPAAPKNMRTALERDAALLVYPGGDRETYRASWHSADIDFAQRTGFVRLALDMGVPIVPVVAIGGQETALFLGRGERVARLLHLHQLLRLDVAPVQVAPPWGVTVLDIPGRVPLPAKITVEVLPPIDLRSELGTDPDVERGYDLITARMQDTLDQLAAARTLPVIG